MEKNHLLWWFVIWSQHWDCVWNKNWYVFVLIYLLINSFISVAEVLRIQILELGKELGFCNGLVYLFTPSSLCWDTPIWQTPCWCRRQYKDVQTMTPPFKEPRTLCLSHRKHIEMEIEMGFCFCFCFRINETQMCQRGSIVVKNKSFGVTQPWF